MRERIMPEGESKFPKGEEVFRELFSNPPANPMAFFEALGVTPEQVAEALEKIKREEKE